MRAIKVKKSELINLAHKLLQLDYEFVYNTIYDANENSISEYIKTDIAIELAKKFVKVSKVDTKFFEEQFESLITDTRTRQRLMTVKVDRTIMTVIYNR